MEKNDGGPAFPIWQEGMSVGTDAGPGMSLRDYFAAKALQGMLCNGFLPARFTKDTADWDYVKAAYALADAMLAEREK